MSSALVCLSGGVDSTIALLISTRAFSSTRAAFVDTRGEGPPSEAVESCRQLGVELQVIDAVAEFRELVYEPSRMMLSRGLTPNPCAMCNARVKLALPFSMLKPGEKLVTGHYAKFVNNELKRGTDPSKDQSYFLSLVPRPIISSCFFPLADRMKKDVQKEMTESGLSYIKKESQDLCFKLSDTGKPGDIVNLHMEKVGEHNGLEGYTEGQRRGLGAHGGRKFVVRLDRERNRVIIGDRDHLYRIKCVLNSINWFHRPAENSFTCLVQTRYRKPAAKASVTLMESGAGAEVLFETGQRSLAPGQIGALYSGDSVLGGGVISEYREDENVQQDLG